MLTDELHVHYSVTYRPEKTSSRDACSSGWEANRPCACPGPSTRDDRASTQPVAAPTRTLARWQQADASESSGKRQALITPVSLLHSKNNDCLEPIKRLIMMNGVEFQTHGSKLKLFCLRPMTNTFSSTYTRLRA